MVGGKVCDEREGDGKVRGESGRKWEKCGNGERCWVYEVGLFVFRSWAFREEAGVEVVVKFNKSMAVDELIRVIIKLFAEFVVNFAGFFVGAFG